MTSSASMVAAAALALAAPAAAQDPAEDWDLTARPEQQLTLATLDFGANILALRCQAGTLDLLVTGAPVSTGATRTVRVTAGAIGDEEQTWIAHPGQPVIGAAEPARLARQLRGGGELDLRIEPEGEAGRPHRYRLPVPASAASVDAVLTACGEPLDEARDLLRRVSSAHSPIWRVHNPPEYPAAAMQRGVQEGAVRLSCVISAEWGLHDCRALSEVPAGVGFAAAAIQAAERDRLDPPADGSDVRGQVVHFTNRFRLAD